MSADGSRIISSGARAVLFWADARGEHKHNNNTQVFNKVDLEIVFRNS